MLPRAREQSRSLSKGINLTEAGAAKLKMCGPQVRAGGNAGDAEFALSRDMRKVCSGSADPGTNGIHPAFPALDGYGLLVDFG